MGIIINTQYLKIKATVKMRDIRMNNDNLICKTLKKTQYLQMRKPY